MPQSIEYLAILRCQTWNVWPEETVIEYRRVFRINDGTAVALPTRLAILSYPQRTAPERYLKEKTELGPLLWDGEIPELHHVRDEILVPPEGGKITKRHRKAQRGEVDICIRFKFDGEVPRSLIETLQSTTHAIISLLNLQLRDYLIPTVPFHLLKVPPRGGNQWDNLLLMRLCRQRTLPKETLEATLSNVADVLLDSSYGEKLRVALELYAAHFTETQVRVRFLLLVMAMESLAKPTAKHPVAIELLRRWQQELEEEANKFDPSSEEALSLKALSRELSFREEDSIRAQVRKLFASLPGISVEEATDLQKRALCVYDKRSTLVHDGYLPIEELSKLEPEARALLEKVFSSAMGQSKKASLVSENP